MKKIISLLLVLVCLVSLSACGGTSQDASGANKLVYGEKYICLSDMDIPAEQRSYYIVEKDTLSFHYYSMGYSGLNHYTKSYKYEIMDEGTLAYFYDSIVYHDDHDSTGPISTDGSGILLFSENVIATGQNQTLYVRESYLENELTNFGK